MTSLETELQRLTRDYGLVALYAFGSRAEEVLARVRGESVEPLHPASDLDVGAQPPRGAKLGAAQKVSLTQALEDLFEVPRVDLVVVTEAPPFLALDVICGELLVCTDLDEQAEYELYVLRRAGDLLPFERERSRMILDEGAR